MEQLRGYKHVHTTTCLYNEELQTTGARDMELPPLFLALLSAYIFIFNRDEIIEKFLLFCLIIKGVLIL